MPILSVDRLSLDIDKTRILDSVSFSLEEGDFAVLCGRNGAGKSQLMRILKGLRQPDEGRILIEGKDVTKDRKARLSSLALVFQDADMQIVGETVEKDVAFGPLNLGWTKDEVEKATDETLSLMGLEGLRKRRPSTLSGGEKRKLAIAGNLAMKPRIMLLDEPFAALDWPGTKLLLSSLVDLNRRGLTILVVSHEIEKFLFHTTKVLIMQQGRLVHEGRPEDSLGKLRQAEVYVPDLPLEALSWL